MGLLYWLQRRITNSRRGSQRPDAARDPRAGWRRAQVDDDPRKYFEHWLEDTIQRMFDFSYDELQRAHGRRPVDRTPQSLRTLGLSWPCTITEVKAAFRRGAATRHPDRGGSHEAFIEWKRAYDDAVAFVRSHNLS